MRPLAPWPTPLASLPLPVQIATLERALDDIALVFAKSGDIGHSGGIALRAIEDTMAIGELADLGVRWLPEAADLLAALNYGISRGAGEPSSRHSCLSRLAHWQRELSCLARWIGLERVVAMEAQRIEEWLLDSYPETDPRFPEYAAWIVPSGRIIGSGGEDHASFSRSFHDEFGSWDYFGLSEHVFQVQGRLMRLDVHGYLSIDTLLPIFIGQRDCIASLARLHSAWTLSFVIRDRYGRYVLSGSGRNSWHRHAAGNVITYDDLGDGS